MKMRAFLLLIAAVSVAGCQTEGGSVTEKVLADFGLREQPEGYVSGSDKVFQELDTVGKTEMKRLNTQGRNGEIKFQEDGLRGSYFKEVRVYEDFMPLDAKAAGHLVDQDRGYVGTIEYRYRVYRGASKPTRAEAAAVTADTPTDAEGRETLRYTFTSGGTWNGAKGEKAAN